MYDDTPQNLARTIFRIPCTVDSTHLATPDYQNHLHIPLRPLGIASSCSHISLLYFTPLDHLGTFVSTTTKESI
jgi:hypothetical protein